MNGTLDVEPFKCCFFIIMIKTGVRLVMSEYNDII